MVPTADIGFLMINFLERKDILKYIDGSLVILISDMKHDSSAEV